jgi:hypothetical protein
LNPETVSLSLYATLPRLIQAFFFFLTVPDEAVEKLGVLFSEQLLLAALDLIDRDCGKENAFFQVIPFSPVIFLFFFYECSTIFHLGVEATLASLA